MKTLNFLIFIGASIFWFSCAEVREEITINKNGSGTYEVSSDIIPMMRTMMESFASMMPDSVQTDSAATTQKIEEMIWKDFPEEVDSIINVSNELPPEVKDDPVKTAMVENITMYMRGGRKQGVMLTGLEYNFKDSEDLNQFQNLLDEYSQKDQRGGQLPASKSEVKITSSSFYRLSKFSEPLPEKQDEAMASLFKDLQLMTFYTVINFPRKIKRVDLKGYTIVDQSDKSVTLKYDIEHALFQGQSSEINRELK